MLRNTLAVVAITFFSPPAVADVLWTEDAEGGAANVATNVSAYPLIQSEVVAQGGSAFHLANPGLADNWFSITPPITVEADTRLFFQSRLSWANTTQVARVQASANGGASWPINLYSQAGTGDAGEGGFSLKEIDLSSHASQTLNFRFLYDFTSGSGFPHIDPGVGWHVDDIQFADSFQKSLYSIGNPSSEEQLYLEYINRARADAVAEGNRLSNESNPEILNAYNFFNISPQDIVYQFSESVGNGYLDNVAQPLSFNAALLQASELHSQDMLDNAFQDHFSSNSPPAPFQPGYSPMQRAQAFGYVGGVGENVYAHSEGVAEGHAAFDVDWGPDNPGHPDYNPAFAGQGMQNPAGHRANIHNAEFKEIGVGLVMGSNAGVGPQIVTQNFGLPGDVTFVTGVVYEDLNANNFYDVGEGRPGVRVDVEGSAYYAVSTDSGGYSAPVSGSGDVEVLFSGGGFDAYAITASIVDGLNVKVDYLATLSASYAADFDNDGDVDGQDLVAWGGDFGGPGSDADGDGDSDGQDFLVWQRELGSGLASVTSAQVPEPSAAPLMAIACAALALLAGSRDRRGAPQKAIADGRYFAARSV